MEIKSKTQTTHTYTVSFGEHEVDTLLKELDSTLINHETHFPKTYSLFSKLQQVRLADIDDEQSA